MSGREREQFRLVVAVQLDPRHGRLSASNTGDMKWKKFHNRLLCVRAELFVCKSPNCRACNDYAQCFSVEEGAALPAVLAARRDSAT